MIPETKECGICKKIKAASEYQLRKKKNKTTGEEHIWLRMECNECYRENSRKRYANNSKKYIDRNKKYYELNKDRINAYRKEWDIKNAEHVLQKRKQRYANKSDEIKAKRKEYYYKNKQKCIESVNNYISNNLLKVRQRQRDHHRKKKSTDASYSILKVLRTRINAALKNKAKKAYKTKELVGCDMATLIKHLESLFLDGMNWDNYGLKGWHVDHIIPCASFDFTDIEQQKKCFHYTNLQPLWWHDNLKKSSKLDYEIPAKNNVQHR